MWRYDANRRQHPTDRAWSSSGRLDLCHRSRDRDAVSATGNRGLLLLADISGYTAFLQAVAGAHGEEMANAPEVPAAYPLMTSLLDGIVEQVAPPFMLSKLEGDAVFAYAPDAEFSLRGARVLDCMRTCYDHYRSRRDATENLMLCSCAACSMLSTLELKFVLHRGDYVVQSIAGHEELLGPDVTVAHLLLKNRVREVLGTTAYVLCTNAAAEHLGLPVSDAHRHVEHYEHYPPVEAYVLAL